MIDTLVFIPLYVLIFLLLCQLLAYRRQGFFGRKTTLPLEKFFTEKDSKNGNSAKQSGFTKRNAVWLALIAVVIVLLGPLCK